MAKLDMRDEAELKRIKKLFEEGLNEAAKDPDRVDQLRRDRESLIEPWEEAVKVWKKNVDEFNKSQKERDGKKASLVTAQQVVDKFLGEDK